MTLETDLIPKSVPKPREFRLFLQEELLRRCRANPAYSLRAFARALQVDYSTLAKIIKGNRPLGKRAIVRMAKRLGLSPAEVEGFTSTFSGKKQQVDQVDLENYQQLSLDSFQIISDWYHYAILELLRLDHFETNAQWIAKTLSIRLSEVNFAIERLTRVGILEITPEGKWVDHSEGKTTTLGNDFSAGAFRNLQRQVLQKALVALEEVPMDHRDQTSMTMAIDSRLISEAKKRITQFRRELSNFLSRGDRRDEVYNLGISLYPITQNLERK